MVLLKDIILILFLAVLVILIMSRFRIPPIIGLLLTGVIIGPSALQIVESIPEIEVLAEIGIILLMFTIGLEFSLHKVREMMKSFLLFGGSQVALSWLFFSLIFYWYGLEIQEAMIVGFILALSSTAIVLKLLQDKDELGTPAGIKTTGILLFQDAIIIPAMIIFPFISQLSEAPPLPIIMKILLVIGGMALIYVMGKVLLPRIFNVILKERIQELLTVVVFVFLFGTAFVAYKLGASLAMGAFIAGMAISDSEYAHQIITDIIPSKHIFNSIFFISIGMFINLSFVMDHYVQILVITGVIVSIKIVLIFTIFLVLRQPLNQGIITAFGLAHIGEFSFILLKVAQEYQLLASDMNQMLMSAALLSMLYIPFAMALGKRITRYEKFKKKAGTNSPVPHKKNHTIIAGFGINGQNIARILKLLKIPYSIIELNHLTVKKYQSLDEPIFYGNFDRMENMKFIGITEASLLIIAISDMDATRRSISLARKLNPSIKIIVRANFINQVEQMYNLGADLVLAQDMETSLIFIHHILKYYKMPDHISRIQTNLLRKEHYSFFLKEEIRDAWKIALFDFIEQDNELFFISPHSQYVSMKISQLKPYEYEDMNFIGVIRKNQVLTKSIAELVIEKFDTIILSGNHKQVSEALTWMENNN